MFIPLKKSSVNENQTFGGVKLDFFFGGEKETWGVGREIFFKKWLYFNWPIRTEFFIDRSTKN
jgi:hypothetical protein